MHENSAACLLQMHGMTRAGLGFAIPYLESYPTLPSTLAAGRQGYARAGQTARARDNLRWGADYLLRTISRPASGASRYQDFYIAYQARPSPSRPIQCWHPTKTSNAKCHGAQGRSPPSTVSC